MASGVYSKVGEVIKMRKVGEVIKTRSICEESGLLEGLKGACQVFFGSLVLGLLSAVSTGIPKAMAIQFAMMLTMIYWVMYIAVRAAVKDIKYKEEEDKSDVGNEIIDGR